MAKFGIHFDLTPLINHVNQESPLGVSEDSESDNAIVTLGENRGVIYRLADQNQIISWSTREKFTSPVIYDKRSGKYAAVFNKLFIRCWSPEISNIDKIKKYKFKSNIRTIVTLNSGSFVVFETGDITTLEHALQNHKTFVPDTVLDEKEEILFNKFGVLKSDRYIGMLIENKESQQVHLLWSTSDSTRSKLEHSKIPLSRPAKLIGCCFRCIDQQTHIVTCWSDGIIHEKSVQNTNVNESFFHIESISCQHSVSIVSLDKDYLAIYGGNSNQDGGLLIIYNMQFKVTQCKLPFKVQAVNVKLFNIGEKLLLPALGHLVVVPYHLAKEKFSALVGTQCSIRKDIMEQMEEVIWTEKYGKTVQSFESKIKEANEFLKSGYSFSSIGEYLVTYYMEQNNLKNLKLILEEQSVITEEIHAKVLFYILGLPKKMFKKQKKISDDRYPEELQPLQRHDLLHIILNKPVPGLYLEKWGMQLENLVKFFKFILYILRQEKYSKDFIEKIVKWTHLILDTNSALIYNSKEEDEVFKILSDLKDHINYSAIPQSFIKFADKTFYSGKHTKANRCYTVETLYL